MIHRQTKWRPNFILTTVQLAESGGVVVYGANGSGLLQTRLDVLRQIYNSFFILSQRQNRNFYWCELRMELEHHSFFSPHFFFVVRVHHEREYFPVDPGGGLDHVRKNVLVRFMVEVSQVGNRIGIQPLAFGVYRLPRMSLQIKIGSIRDAFELVPLFLFLLSIREEPVLKVDASLRIMRQFVLPLFVLPQILPLHSKPNVPIVAFVNPLFVELLIIRVTGLQDMRRFCEVLDLHLFELASSKNEVAGRDLVAKRFADLRDAEGQLTIRRVENILEVHKNALRSFGSEVSEAGLILNRAYGGSEHQIELARLGELGRAAHRTFVAFDFVGAEPRLAFLAVNKRI